MRLTWDLPGGIHPPENKDQSLMEPLAQAGVPEILVFPVGQHIGAPAKPVVKVGERVLKGQVIAEAAGFVSAPVHASSSGTVKSIGPHPIPHPSGMEDTCIIIETDGRDEWIELPETEANVADLENEEILKRIQGAGIAGMGGAGFPAHVKLNPPPDTKIDTLIINATECEPYITSDDCLIQDRPHNIVKGIQILAKLQNEPKYVLVGMEDNKPKARQILQQAIDDAGLKEKIEIVTFPTKYPSGGEKQLIWILTGREVPTGGLPAHIGVVVQNIGSTEAIYQAVTHHRPLISRITTVTGDAAQRPRNYEVLLGTPVNHLLKESQFEENKCSRLVIGGPMMGYSVETADIPVVKTTNCILVPTEQEIPSDEPANPCIRCGICATVCPVSLLPQQMYWHSQAQDYQKLQAHNLMDCIECGCCSYVCPSRIPLVQYYRAAKGEMRQMAADKQKSDLARERFEARKARLEKEAEEKAEKQRARKAAAEARKNKSNESNESKPDAVASAIADASAAVNPEDPAAQIARLEKTIAASRDALVRAEEKLEESRGTDTEDRASAKLESIKLKLSQNEAKLATLKATDVVEKTVEKAAEVRSGKTDEERVAEAADKIRNKIDELTRRKEEEQDHEEQQRLEQEIEKLREKFTETSEHNTEHSNMDAAAAAIEKAKAKSAAMADMNPQEKLRNQVESLEARLAKAKDRLAQAENEGADNLEAFQAGVDKLAEKLDAARKELGEQG
jgi:electron transport complex protein RnfC